MAPVPFLLRAQHRFLMRSAHHNAVLIGQLGVGRIVFVKGVIPHRRPEVVRAQPQEHFEYPGIKFVAVIRDSLGNRRVPAQRRRAKFFSHPVGQVGRFVVEEDAAIFHDGAGLDHATRADVERVTVDCRHIGPPIPRRNTDLPGHFIDAVDRAALVAARDHDGTPDARQRALDGLDDKRLPLSADGIDVQLPARDQAIDQCAFADRADEHGRSGRRRRAGRMRGLESGHALDVGLQIKAGTQYARPVVFGDEEWCG